MDAIEKFRNWLAGRYKGFAIAVIVSFGASLVSVSLFRPRVPQFKVGDVATRNFKAFVPVRIEDAEATKRKVAQSADEIPEVFDYSDLGLPALEAKVDSLFAALQKSDDITSIEMKLRNVLGEPLTSKQISVLQNAKKKPLAKTFLKRAIVLLSGYWIVEDATKPRGTVAIFRNVETGEEVSLKKDEFHSKVISNSQLPIFLHQNVNTAGALAREDRVFLGRLISKLIEPNLSFNAVETTQRIEDVQRKIDPVWVEAAEGEMIVREGQRIEKRHQLLLEGLRQALPNSGRSSQAFKLGLFILFLLWLFQWVGKRNFKKFRLSQRDQLVLGGFFLGTLSLLIFLKVVLGTSRSPEGFGDYLLFALPLAFSCMSLRLFTSMEITLFFGLLLSLCVTIAFDEPFFGLVCFCVCLVGAARMRHIRERVDVLKAGILVGFIQGIVCVLGITLGYISSPNDTTYYFVAMGMGFVGGIFSAGLVLAVQPLLEYVGYATDLRYMELASSNHPLLKEMILKAPGTYFHSFTVSQLAEKAAEAINGNPLFARVAALYHDIGKTRKSQYFIENIKGENKHDKLAPTMSALIISNHVRDGIELAQEYKLPQSVVDIIPQHHGTALISYFFDKAIKQHEDNREEIDEREFRYPGPKPQTREAAIIMLADAVEATAKALNLKDLDELRKSVHTSIQRFFLDGQLNECDLSLKDLTAIGNAFVQVLLGVYHQRIDYPHLRQQNEENLKTGPHLVKKEKA